jgi:energy-coupling factor transporter ATP-binding protein EcfA2
MKFDIGQINFGVPAAERDSDLISCFVSSTTYKNLKSGRKTIILGNRGSGKSALFRMLKEEEELKGNIIIELPPEEYAYELLSLTIKKESEGAWAKQGAYAVAWKYLIFITIMKRLTVSGKSFKRGPEAKIYEYLRNNHKHIETNPIGIMISYLKRMEGIKIGKYEAGIRAKELKQLYSLEEIADLIPEIDNACKNKKIIILIDELDKGWDASEDAISFIAGLFNSAVSINNQLKNVNVFVSLRKELYDNIPALYEDAQKVRDIIETVEWDEIGLLELIARRISSKIPETSELDFEERWNAIFSEILDYRQTKSFNYIVDRTLYRPREIIQFCNDISEKSRTTSDNIQTPFNYRQIAEAEYSYSESRIKDISAEFKFQYPDLQSIFETFRGLSYNYTREFLEYHILCIVLGESPISKIALKWCEDIDPEALIHILWTVGFLRAQAVGGIKAKRRSGSTYLGPHQISSLNLRNIQRFHVHPMFRAYLGLKESKS